MKRIIAALLLIVLSFSMLACAAPAPTDAPAPAEAVASAVEGPSEKEVLFDKYEDIINALEAEDYDSAIDSITSMKPVPTPEPVTKVEITLDNYKDYFDLITEIGYENDEKDAYGNVTYRDRFTFLQLKDKYYCDPNKPGQITVRYEYNYSDIIYKGKDIDFESFTTSNRIDYIQAKGQESRSQSSRNWFDENASREYLTCSLYNETAGVYDNGSYISLVSDLEIINVSGTIYLLNN